MPVKKHSYKRSHLTILMGMRWPSQITSIVTVQLPSHMLTKLPIHLHSKARGYPGRVAGCLHVWGRGTAHVLQTPFIFAHV